MFKRTKSLSKNKDVKKLSINFLSLFSIQGLNLLLPLITLPYLFRVLGAEKFGLIAFAFSTITFFRVFTDYGFQLYATREISQNINDKNKTIEIFNTILSTKIILLIFSFLILTLLILFFNKFSNEWVLFYFTFLFVVGETIFPVWFFQGVEDMKYIGYLNLFTKIFFTLGIFIFIQDESDYIIQPLLNGIGMIFIGIYSLYLINKKYEISFKFESIKNIKKVLIDSWNIFITQLMPNLYNNFSTFLLGFLSSMENVGYFSLAVKIIDVGNNIITIISNVTFPHLTKDYSKFKIITKFMITIACLITISIYLTSNLILPSIFGEKIYFSLNLIYILAFSPILFSITYSFGSNKLLIFHKDNIYKNISLITSIIGTILLIILINLYDIYGAAIAIIITRISISISTYYYSRRINYVNI
jgi:polysaccharide transporter, PST family